MQQAIFDQFVAACLILIFENGGAKNLLIGTGPSCMVRGDSKAGASQWDADIRHHPGFLAFGSKEKMARTKLISVRLSDTEYTRLATAAETASTSPSTLLRNLALGSLGPAVSATPTEPRSAAGLLTRKVSSRLTAAEAEVLASRAKECDLPVSAYVRSILRGSTPSARRPEAHAAIVALSRVGNNLNQLTRLAHGGTLLPRDLFSAIEALRTEVYRVREEILATEDRL